MVNGSVNDDKEKSIKKPSEWPMKSSGANPR